MAASHAQLKAALKESAGIYSLAADKLGVSRQTVWQRVNKSEELQEWIADIEARILDAAEGVIVQAITKNRSEKTAKWYLQMKGKSRGYVTRQELTGEGGGAIAVNNSVNVTIEYVEASHAEEEDVI